MLLTIRSGLGLKTAENSQFPNFGLTVSTFLAYWFWPKGPDPPQYIVGGYKTSPVFPEAL